jgi:O-antigen ligase
MRKISLSFWLFAGVFFTSTWDLLFKLDVGGFTLKLYQPLALLSLLALLWEKRKDGIGKLLAPLFSPFPAAFLLLGIFYLAVTPWSAFPLKSFLYSCWLFFALFAIFFVAVHLGNSNPRERFLKLICITLLFLAYVILVDYVYYYLGFKGGLLGWNQDKITGLGLSRPHAFSSEPSFAATFMSLGLITSSVAAYNLLTKRRWLFLAGFLLVLFAIIATTSRTGWVCLGLGFGMICLAPLLAGKKIQWKLVGGLAGIFLTVVILFIITTPPAQRQVMTDSFVASIFQGKDSSGNSRIKAHILAWEIAKKTSFVGTGFAASYKYFKDSGGWDYHAPGTFDEKQYGNEMIMSTWGQLLAEGGLPAVILFLVAAIAMVTTLFRKWKESLDPLALGSMVASFVFFFFAAFWLGNVNRGDVWVWYGIWTASIQPQSRR